MVSPTKSKYIILKTRPYGESDLVIHALAKAGNKVSFIAKGARKSRKRFGGGVLQPTHFVEFIYKAPAEDVHESRLVFLMDAQLINGFVGLRSHYDRLQLGLYFVSLFDKVAVEGLIESEYGFDLLGNGLRAAESATDLELLKAQFEVKFMHQQGVLPPELSLASLLQPSLSQCDSIDRNHIENHSGASFKNLQHNLDHYMRAYLGSAGG